MHWVRILILLLYITSTSVVWGQSAKKLIKTGDKYYNRGFYDEAIKAYQEAAEQEPDDLTITYKIGLAFLESKFKHRALPFLQKVKENTEDSTSSLNYHLGLAYQYNHQFVEALTYFHFYRNVTENPYTVDQHIKQCNIGIEYVNNPKDVKIINISSLNSDNQDYAPLITADGSSLIFTSRREGSTGGKTAYDNNFYEDIYITHKQKNNWSAPEKISENINTYYHECGAAISPDGKTLFIYVDEGDGDIYVSTLEGTEWTPPIPLNQNINSPYRELSVSVNQDGTELYFSSNRPGGYGGFDIYVSKKDRRGQWAEPVNMGPKINTKEDEDAPFIHPKGDMLYFSSTGHLGMGGYDIFRSKLYEGKWSTPINMGYPINTAQDDIYFVIAENNTFGYYATAREDGLGGNDIYAIEMDKKDYQPASPKPIAKTKKTAPAKEKNVAYFTGKVTDASTGKAVYAELVLSDNHKNIVIDRQYSDPKTGTFRIAIPKGDNFGLTVEADGYLFFSQHFDAEKLKGKEIKKNIYLKKAEVGSVAILKNIFFNSGDAIIQSASIAELDRLYELLKGNPTLHIQINGHTDNVGDDAYNQKLSEQRAQAVAKYLLQYGIPAERVTSKGFGETRPLVSNDDETGGREINRRTEIEIVSIGTPMAEQQKEKGLDLFKF
uniref:OmpA family protein n=1 Tax=Roseihalotalea indica TaxID=2867963 RepID=A0AA49GMZ6_9BACT|nr:OmpA family protein [Tunicatimonas sp. TK19036]